MKDPVNQEQLTARINHFLGHHVEIAEDVDAKRCELCGVLLEVAAEGDRSISAEWLLRKASIPLHSFRDWPRLRKRLRDRLDEQLAKEQYDASLDVRPGFVVGNGVTIVSGESGQGKTWRLARAASDSSKSEALVVWVPASRGTADVAEYAAREIWNHGLERDAQLTLERVAARRERSNPDITTPWAIVCVDDVRSPDEAQFLYNLDWRRWGMSLVMSTSPDVARSLALQGRCLSLPVKDFDHLELRAYLERRGLSWVKIAHDVRELIRRPILAKIYVDIAQGDPGFNPRTEYDLLDATWDRTSDPTNIGLVRALAGTIHEADAGYPWPTEYVLKLGVSADAICRLTKQGWIRDVGDGQIAMSHPRFLCWAYAKFLVAQFASGQLSVDALGEELGHCQARPTASRPLQLGYVPMDALWLLLKPGATTAQQNDLWKLISALERFGGMGHEDEGLYQHLLASLGERVVPLLVGRTKQSGEDNHNLIPTYASEALLIISRDYPSVVVEAAKTCLDDGHLALIELGLRLSAAFPESASPDRVWDIYRSHVVGEKAGARDYFKQGIAAAFRAVAEHSLDWFRNKLNDGDEDDSCFASLVYTLGDLGGNSDARRIWSETKNHLFQAIPAIKRRCLVGCIANFTDTDEYERLEEWSASEDELVGRTAAWALACRVPNRALQVLANVPTKQLMFRTTAIGTALFAAIPEETSEELTRLIHTRPNDARMWGDFFSGHGDRLDAPTVSVLLDGLDDGLQAYLTASNENERGTGHIALSLVDGLHGECVLTELRKRRGSSLEANLVAFACSRIAKICQYVDHEFEQAREILKRIAGEGFTTLVNALISAEHQQSRMKGCETAVVRPNDDTRRLLRKEALSDVMWESGASKINVVQRRAIDSLAALGENAGLVRGIVKWGLDVSPDIAALREGQPAMSDEELRPALELLDQPESPQYPHAILAIGQSGRNDFQERIEAALLNSDYASENAQACLLSLEDLAIDCDRVLDRLVEQYRSGHYKFAVMKALAGCNVDKEVYVRLLPSEDALDEMDQRIVSFLAGDKAMRPAVENHIRRLIASGGSPMHDTIHLLDPSHDADRKLLWDKSLQPDTGLHVVGSKSGAIRALGATAPDAAFEIGVESLLSDRRDRDNIPHVLMQLDPGRAITELSRVASKTIDKVLCCAIGRAFREHGAAAQLREPIAALLRNDNWKCRRAGAFIAGFLEQDVVGDELAKVAYGDPKWAVCTEAQTALRARQREAEAMKLVATMGTVQPTDVWGTIDCILHLSDPGVLVLASDPIGFLEKLREQPFVVRKYAFDAVKNRHKKVEDDMTSLHGKWKDGD